jgi:hypothetical protein
MGDRQLGYKTGPDRILVAFNGAVLGEVSVSQHMGVLTFLPHCRSIIVVDTNLFNCIYCSYFTYEILENTLNQESCH